MNRVAFSICAWGMIVWGMSGAPLFAQSDSPTVYAESFRQGSTQITEENFEAKLSPQNPTYREMIKDSRGDDRYELTITPRVLDDGNQITFWRVRMRDLHHSIYGNILTADQLTNQEPSTDAKNNLWRLDPNRFGPVPIRARRIIKVDGFYVVIQVKYLHFTPLDSPYLDSMVVRFAFSNTDPRTSR
jgi:hypothetical protein